MTGRSGSQASCCFKFRQSALTQILYQSISAIWLEVREPGSILQRTGTWHCKQLRIFVLLGRTLCIVMWLTWLVCFVDCLCALLIFTILYWSFSSILQSLFWQWWIRRGVSGTSAALGPQQQGNWGDALWNIQLCPGSLAARYVVHAPHVFERLLLHVTTPWVLLQQLVWRPGEIQMKPLQPSKACQRRGKTYTSGCIIWSTHLIYSFIFIYHHL